MVVVGLAVFVWIASRQFPSLPEGYPGPALFPKVVAVLLLLAGLGLIIQGVRPDEEQAEAQTFRPLAVRLAGALGAVALFLTALPTVGAGPGAGAACLLMASTLRVDWKQAVVATVATGLAVHLMFTSVLGLP